MGVLEFPMDRERRENLAIERAEKYAPRPHGGYAMAGVCGATLMLLAEIAAARFYNWDLLAHIWIAAMAAAAGFIGGFAVGALVHRRRARRSRSARRVELNKIDAHEDRQPTMAPVGSEPDRQVAASSQS